MRAALDSEYAQPDNEPTSDFKSAMMSDYERKRPKTDTNPLPNIMRNIEVRPRGIAAVDDDLSSEFGGDDGSAMERALDSAYSPQRQDQRQELRHGQRQTGRQRQQQSQRRSQQQADRQNLRESIRERQRQDIAPPVTQSTPPRFVDPAAQNNLSPISSDPMRDRNVPVLLSSVYDEEDGRPPMYLPRDQASSLNFYENRNNYPRDDFNHLPNDDIELGPREGEDHRGYRGYEGGDANDDNDDDNSNDGIDDESGDSNRYSLDSDSNPHKKRRLDAQELEKPLIYEVPVDEFPAIVWNDGFAGQVANIEQNLELTESESDYSSDDSVMEIINDSDGDSDFESAEADKEYEPPSGPELDEGNSSSDSESDEPRSFQDDDDEDADFEDSEAELSEDDIPMLGSVAEIRKGRPQRTRVPTLRNYLGERIEYKAVGKRELLTAIDVRMVEEPEKQPRRRARRRKVQQSSAGSAIGDIGGGFELSNQDAEDINVNVYDSARRAFRDRTVAKSLNGNDFVQLYNKENDPVPNVFQQLLFGSERSPLRCFVLRIEPTGIYYSPAEDNKASTFVVWQGTCDVNLNSTEFGLSKGRACIAPRSNDLSVKNNSESDVFLFICEVNNAELAEMLPRDAQSMVSMFHAPSSSEEDEGGYRSHGSDGGDDGQSFDAGPNVDDDADSGAEQPPSESQPSESQFSPKPEISDNMLQMLDSRAGSDDGADQQQYNRRPYDFVTDRTAPSLQPYMDSHVPNTKVPREDDPNDDISTDESLAAAMLDNDETPENLTPTERIVRNIALKVGERHRALLQARSRNTPDNAHKSTDEFLRSPQNVMRADHQQQQETPRASQEVPLGSVANRAVPSPFLDLPGGTPQLNQFMRSPLRPPTEFSPFRGLSPLQPPLQGMSPLREPPVQLFPTVRERPPLYSPAEGSEYSRDGSESIDLDNVKEEHSLDLSIMRPTMPERNPLDMLNAIQDLF